MKHVEAELLADGGGDAVVRLPGRQFHGVLVQGDALGVRREGVSELVSLCDAGDLDGARQTAALLLTDRDD